MKIRRFNQITESDDYIEYTLEDSQKLASNILNEWERPESIKNNDDFQKGRMLGALETILILNGKLQGGKTYAQDDENFTTKMIRLTKSFLEEPTVEPPTDDDDKLE